MTVASTSLAEARDGAASAHEQRLDSPLVASDSSLSLDQSLAVALLNAASPPDPRLLPAVPPANDGGVLAWVPDHMRGLWAPQFVKDPSPAPVHSADAKLAPSTEWAELLDRSAALLDRVGYSAIPSMLPPDLLEVAADHYQRLIETGAMRLDTSYSRRFVAHRDPIAEWLHQFTAAALAGLFAARYRPSYSFVCGYVGGAELPRHTDRSQCEITVSLCLAATPGAERWPLFLESPAEAVLIEAKLGVGSALVFKGRELPHYRKPLPAGEFFLSILFHFVPLDFDGSMD